MNHNKHRHGFVPSPAPLNGAGRFISSATKAQQTALQAQAAAKQVLAAAKKTQMTKQMTSQQIKTFCIEAAGKMAVGLTLAKKGEPQNQRKVEGRVIGYSGTRILLENPNGKQQTFPGTHASMKPPFNWQAFERLVIPCNVGWSCSHDSVFLKKKNSGIIDMQEEAKAEKAKIVKPANSRVEFELYPQANESAQSIGDRIRNFCFTHAGKLARGEIFGVHTSTYVAGRIVAFDQTSIYLENHAARQVQFGNLQQTKVPTWHNGMCYVVYPCKETRRIKATSIELAQDKKNKDMTPLNEQPLADFAKHHAGRMAKGYEIHTAREVYGRVIGYTPAYILLEVPPTGMTPTPTPNPLPSIPYFHCDVWFVAPTNRAWAFVKNAVLDRTQPLSELDFTQYSELTANVSKCMKELNNTPGFGSPSQPDPAHERLRRSVEIDKLERLSLAAFKVRKLLRQSFGEDNV